MQFNNQKTRNVADAVAKILAGESAKQEPKMLEEELKGQQHKIDANKNNKIDAHDFKLLRAKKEVKKEEVEQEEEKSMTFSEMLAAYKEHGLAVIAEEPTEEQFNKEIEDQIASATGKKKQPGVSTPSTQGVKSMPEEVEVFDANEINGVTIDTIEEEVELVEGILSKVAGKLANATGITPQDVANSTIREFNKKAPGTKMHGHPNFSKFKSDVHAHVSSAKNADEAIKRSSDNHVMSLAKKHFTEEIDTIEEKTLTEPEMKKKEEVVKSMKKKLPGFKERYGERAKNVMYATATKMAKKD